MGACAGNVQRSCEVLDVWYGVAIKDFSMVQCLIVTTGAPIATLLWDHVERGGPTAGGGTDDAKFQHVVELLPGRLEAFGGQPSRARANRWSGGLDMMGDVMLNRVLTVAGLGDGRKLR